MRKEEVLEAKIKASYTLADNVALVVGGGRKLAGGRPTLQFMLGIARDGEVLVWFEGWRLRSGKILPPTREVGIKSYNLAWIMSAETMSIIAELVTVAYEPEAEFRGVEFPVTNFREDVE